LFRKFAFNEKDLAVTKENAALLQQELAEKGSFFGYDAIPTQQQLNKQEATLLKSNAEAKYLKGQNTNILDIEV